MAIKEHIGYPDHILQEGNPKLDQEYAHVRRNISFLAPGKNDPEIKLLPSIHPFSKA